MSEKLPSIVGRTIERVARRRKSLPGSDGEHVLQERFGTTDRADSFYENAMQESLTERMQSFIEERRMTFVGTANGVGTPTVVPRFGEQGLVQVLDESSVAWPESGGPNGRTVSNVSENPFATLLFLDWWGTTVGLHVNGEVERRSSVPEAEDRRHVDPTTDWMVLSVEEAYIHCAKHIPKLRLVDEASLLDADPDPAAAVHDHLPEDVKSFIGTRILTFLATADGHHETDVSPRLGPEGFVQILDDTRIAWPEYRGNGVHASLGNLYENPFATLLFTDWWGGETCVRVTGKAQLRDEVEGAVDLTDVDRTKTWVVLDVTEVTVHRTNLPRLAIERHDPPWGTDDDDLKKTGYFTE